MTQQRGTPLEIFRHKLATGQIVDDSNQGRAAEALDRVYNNMLEAYGERPGWKQKLGFGRKPSARGVYIYGPVGRGKSMLMDILYESIPANIKKRRVHFHQFMIEVHDYIHSRRVEEGGDWMDSALPSLAVVVANRCKVLCFDEFHVTDVADAMIMSRLFTEIFEQGVAVVATSNWAPDKLYEGGLQRDRFLPFIELIKKQMDIIHLDSETDYRAQKLREMSVYFSPLNAEAHARADSLFESLTEGEEPYPDLINVKGRTIQVPAVAKGVARFSFANLCERPLGAEDYLEIGKRYHTVFLEDVPKLTYDRRNEAKRFMTLVDILYDNHRNLVITADAQPEKIYSGSDHAFEFERTISRLMEMQSQGYLNHGK